MTQTIWDILATAGISTVIALFVGWLFYSYASLDLRDRARELQSATNDVLVETKKLRHLNKLILLALQNAGFAELRFDDDGEILGLNVTIELGTGSITFANPYDEDSDSYTLDKQNVIKKPIGDSDG